MRTLVTLLLVVLALVVLVVAPAGASEPTVVLLSLRPAPEVLDMTPVFQATQAEKVTLPSDRFEFSALAGTDFDGGAAGGCVSYLIADTSDGRFMFWVDAGGRLNSGRIEPLLGGSTNIGRQDTVRAGAGVLFPEWRLQGARFIVYTRFPF